MFENLRIANIAPQRVHALVTRLIGHLKDRGAPRGGAGQEAERNECPPNSLGSRPTRLACPFTSSATLWSWCDDDYGYGEQLIELSTKTPARTWSALYQQRPAPEESDYFQADWLKLKDHRFIMCLPPMM